MGGGHRYPDDRIPITPKVKHMTRTVKVVESSVHTSRGFRVIFGAGFQGGRGKEVANGKSGQETKKVHTGSYCEVACYIRSDFEKWKNDPQRSHQTPYML